MFIRPPAHEIPDSLDTLGPPLRFILTAGQRHDATQALAPMDALLAAHVLADRAYDAQAILDHIDASGARPIIPQKTGMPRPRGFDPALYEHRNRVSEPSAGASNCAGSLPGTTASQPIISPASISLPSAFGRECRIGQKQGLTPLFAASLLGKASNGESPLHCSA